MFSVINIVFQFQFAVRTVPVVGLIIARNARLHGQDYPLVLVVFLQPVQRVGTDTDQAHLAREDIQELRNLVQAGLAQEAAHSCYSRIVVAVVGAPVLQPDVRGIYLHTAELQHPEGLALVADALSGIEDGTFVVQPDKGSDNDDD